MTYNAKVKLCYINDSDVTPSKYFPELVDRQTITIEAPAQDLNTHQYFELFKSFLRAVGFSTVRPHPITPRLRLDLKSTSWREDVVEAALDRLRNRRPLAVQRQDLN